MKPPVTRRDRVENVRDLAMLARLVFADAVLAEADTTEIDRAARLVLDTGTHLSALLDPGRNAQALATVAFWHRIASAALAGAVVEDLATAVERRRQHKQRSDTA